MDAPWLSVLLLVALAVLAWFVSKAFRGGAPTGESSARADTFASGTGYVGEDLDTLRCNQGAKES